MSRSVWKNSVIFDENVDISGKQIKIINRNFIISSKFLNKKISIYNGKSFINVFIDKYKLGYKFGEFAYTRKSPVHKKKKLKK